jgi:hypothetical protein
MSSLHLQEHLNAPLSTGVIATSAEAWGDLLAVTRSMRETAQANAEAAEAALLPQFSSALSAIDRVTGQTPAAQAPNEIGRRVLRNTLQSNLNTLKIAAENRKAALSVPEEESVLHLHLLREMRTLAQQAA